MKKSYSGLYSYGNEQSVPIPPEIDIGILLGKDGRHVKNVRARTGADCLVDLYKRCVILSGSFKSSVDKAADLVRKHIAAHQRGGVARRVEAYPHPLESHQVFGSAFETDGLVAFTWSTAPKESSAGKGLAYEALPHLPSELSESHITGSQAYSNAATDSLSSTGLTSAVTSSLHTSDDTLPLLEKMLAAREEALRFGEPKFGRVEMRFDLGTQLFYQPKGNSGSFLSGDPMPLEFVKKAKVGPNKDVELTFTSHVAPSVSASLEAHLLSNGFKPVESTEQVALHLEDLENFTYADISFLVSEPEPETETETELGEGPVSDSDAILPVSDAGKKSDSDAVVTDLEAGKPKPGKALKVLEVKTGSSKLFLLSVMSPGGSPDYRLELQAQYDLPEDEPGSSGREVWKYARACAWTGREHPFVKSSSKNAHNFVIDDARFEIKRVFEGRLGKDGRSLSAEEGPVDADVVEKEVILHFLKDVSSSEEGPVTGNVMGPEVVQQKETESVPGPVEADPTKSELTPQKEMNSTPSEWGPVELDPTDNELTPQKETDSAPLEEGPVKAEATKEEVSPQREKDSAPSKEGPVEAMATRKEVSPQRENDGTPSKEGPVEADMTRPEVTQQAEEDGVPSKEGPVRPILSEIEVSTQKEEGRVSPKQAPNVTKKQLPSPRDSGKRPWGAPITPKRSPVGTSSFGAPSFGRRRESASPRTEEAVKRRESIARRSSDPGGRGNLDKARSARTIKVVGSPKPDNSSKVGQKVQKKNGSTGKGDRFTEGVPVDQPVEQSVDQPVNQPVNQPIDHPINHPVDQLNNHPVNHSVNQHLSPHVNQAVNPPLPIKEDYSREKDTEEGLLVRLTFSSVVDENGSHLEITGVAPALNEAAPTTFEDLQILAAFCESLCLGQDRRKAGA